LVVWTTNKWKVLKRPPSIAVLEYFTTLLDFVLFVAIALLQ